MREAAPNILFQMLTRGANTVGYTNYPENVVRQFIDRAAENGIDVFRVFDCLNQLSHMEVTIDEVRKLGKIAEATICYTGDIMDPNRQKYSLQYYANLAKDMERAGANIIAIKDMAGLLKPEAATALVSTLKDAVDLPIHLHSHSGSGTMLYTYANAVNAGVDIIDLATSALSSGTSQPSITAMYYALQNNPRQMNFDVKELEKIDRYWQAVRPYYAGVDAKMTYPNTTVYEHEMPGGQYSNLRQQATAVGLGDRWLEVCEMYHKVNMMFGDIIKVTPSSKVVGDMALFMVQNNLTEEDIAKLEAQGCDVSGLRNRPPVPEDDDEEEEAFDNPTRLDRLKPYLQTPRDMETPFFRAVAGNAPWLFKDRWKKKYTESPVIYAAVVQANSALWRPGDNDYYPAVFVFALDKKHTYDVEWLSQMAEKISELSDSPTVPDDCRKLINTLRDSQSEFCFRIGKSVSGDADAWCATYKFDKQSALPRKALPSDGIVPFLLKANPVENQFVDFKLIPSELYIG